MSTTEESPNKEIKPLILHGSSGSRIRISSRLLDSLSWPTEAPAFECFGVFRNRGELLVAPVNLADEGGEHPFEPVLSFLNLAPDTKIVPLAEIPTAGVIAAPYRVVRFEASWIGDEKKQLDLKIGVEVSRRLGWERGKETSIFPLIWGTVLLLLADFRFSEIQAEDFTGGHLRV